MDDDGSSVKRLCERSWGYNAEASHSGNRDGEERELHGQVQFVMQSIGVVMQEVATGWWQKDSFEKVH